MSRELRIKILQTLAEKYPDTFQGRDFHRKFDESEETSRREAFHLAELGLVDLTTFTPLSHGKKVINTIKITAKGRDFLEPDGGLAAELGVVTVKLHAQTIKDIINTKIESLDTDQSQKARMKEAVKNMPAQTLQDVVTGLVQKGLESGPAAMTWLQQVLGS